MKTEISAALTGECPLCHEGEEGRDHEGDAADEIGERDPPGQTLRFPRPIGGQVSPKAR